MKYTDNAINIITTKTFKGIGRAWINKMLKGNESVETIVSLLNNPLLEIQSYKILLNIVNNLVRYNGMQGQSQPVITDITTTVFILLGIAIYLLVLEVL